MRFLLLATLFCIICVGTVKGQFKHTLIIDTVDQFPGKQKRRFGELPKHFRVEVVLPSDWLLESEDTSVWLDAPATYKLAKSIRSIDPASTLRLSIDDKEGYLEITGIFALPQDTIHIDRIRTFHNSMQDSVYVVKDWFIKAPNKINDTTEDDAQEDGLKYVKSEHSTRLFPKKRCKQSWPTNYSVRINGKQYIVPLRQLWEDGEHAAGHGYKQKNAEKLIEAGRSVDYFHFESRMIKSVLRAEISLQQ